MGPTLFFHIDQTQKYICQDGRDDWNLREDCRREVRRVPYGSRRQHAPQEGSHGIDTENGGEKGGREVDDYYLHDAEVDDPGVRAGQGVRRENPRRSCCHLQSCPEGDKLICTQTAKDAAQKSTKSTREFFDDKCVLTIEIIGTDTVCTQTFSRK